MMDDLLREFVAETGEALAKLDVELVRLERDPNQPELISSIFRLIHTIKGTCGFLNLSRLEALAHAAENVLGRFRDGELDVTPDSVTLILRTLDQVKSMLGTLEQTQQEPAGDDSALIEALNAVAEGRTDAGSAADAGDVSEAEETPVEAAEEPVSALVEEPVVEARPAPSPVRPTEIKSEPKSEEPAAAKNSAPATAGQSIRVGVQVLENLMTTVSELVLVRNQLLQMARKQGDSEFAGPLQQLNYITSELQEGVMKTRMQPIGNAWAQLPRIVRDVAHDLGKKVELEMTGAETELDRQVLELIKDPLTHMIRNAADHGLERPADRLTAGKPETGKIRLTAMHEGGHIVIRIADDGRGLSTAKIREKIVRNGLASAAEVEAMPDSIAQQYIFKAGFSTAEQVTNVSGRGVGMDVVRSNIEKIGGTIEMASTAGRGTEFTIKIPLTLAIVSALIIESSGQRFALPQISVRELVRASQTSEHRIEMMNQTPVLRLRDHLLPLVSLREFLGLGPVEDSATDVFVIVCQVGAHTFSIMVDRVFDAEEIVVKPVAPMLRDNPVFSGNTILGDGSIVMILDPNGIATHRGEAMKDDARADTETAMSRDADDRISLLLFRAGGNTPKAVPLALVARLEEVEASAIEHANGRPVVQYRGGLMPLVTVDPMQSYATEGKQPVVVFNDRDRAMGLVVDEILDIVEDRLDLKLSAQTGYGLMGTAVIGGKATEVVDTGYYLTEAFPDWFGVQNASKANGPGGKVLIVDDSPFFRNMLTPLLRTAGYDVTTAEDGQQAIALCEAGHEFDIIISDIDMPEMDGFSFARTVRSGSRWQEVPIIALSGRNSPADHDRGREVGFTDFIPKFDRQSLLDTLSQTLSATRGAA